MGRSKKSWAEVLSPMERVESGRAMVMILREPVSVSVGGVPKEMTGHEALLRRMYLDAMNGDAAARRDVIELARIGYDRERSPLPDFF